MTPMPQTSHGGALLLARIDVHQHHLRQRHQGRAEYSLQQP